MRLIIGFFEVSQSSPDYFSAGAPGGGFLDEIGWDVGKNCGENRETFWIYSGFMIERQWFRAEFVSCRPPFFDPYCGWLRNPARLKPDEQWNKPSINWCRISQSSTIVHGTAKMNSLVKWLRTIKIQIPVLVLNMDPVIYKYIYILYIYIKYDRTWGLHPNWYQFS